MTADELARAVTAAPGVRWMAGMLIRATNCDAVSWRLVYDRHPETVGSPHYLDLADPATAGCLLAMVVERWPLHVSVAVCDAVEVCVAGTWVRPSETFRGATLGEACARALVEGPR